MLSQQTLSSTSEASSTLETTLEDRHQRHPTDYLGAYLSTTLLSILSDDVQRYILEFSTVGFDGSPLDYMKGSPICRSMKHDSWWKDYIYSKGYYFKIYRSTSTPFTWVDWCQEKMIIGPPRPRGNREICGYDEDYLRGDEFDRHYVPWMNTWPAPGDLSWCKARNERGVPDWSKQDYVLMKKIVIAANVDTSGIRSKVTVKLLKAELRSRGLKVSGLKNQLVQRLMEHLSV